METMIQSLFDWICAQPLDRTWCLGGDYLPFCERCTGLYVGAAVAFVFQILFRTRPGPCGLACYGLLLGQVAAFKLNLLPESALLRTLSGFGLGYALIGLLCLVPGERLRLVPAAFPWRNGFSLLNTALAAVVLGFAVKHGAASAGLVIALAGTAGLLCLVLLSIANVVFLAEMTVKDRGDRLGRTAVTVSLRP
jgi:uncharacterized membrane protein